MAYKNGAQNKNELSNLISLIYISDPCEYDVKKENRAVRELFLVYQHFGLDCDQ